MLTKVRRVVKHHFQAELDGHKRRYMLHHVFGNALENAAIAEMDNKTANVWEERRVAGVGKTWLQRLGDTGTPVKNSFIPYTHFGVSLITLLRMGLSESNKERMYGAFLQVKKKNVVLIFFYDSFPAPCL